MSKLSYFFFFFSNIGPKYNVGYILIIGKWISFNRGQYLNLKIEEKKIETWETADAFVVQSVKHIFNVTIM